jgi:Tol biopolymer transport system component
MSLRTNPPAADTSGATQPARAPGELLSRYALVLILTLATLTVYAAVLASYAHAEECPNAVFRTGPSAHLPDCRAYELVTPPFKNSGAVALVSYSPDGSSALLRATTAFPGLEGFPSGSANGPESFYSTQRTATEWLSVADDPPASEYVPFRSYSIPHDFGSESLDGQTTVWEDRATWQPGNSISIFERLPDRAIVDVGPGLPPSTPPGTVFELGQATEMTVLGLSSDGSRVLYELASDYWPFDDTESGQSLYEYSGTGNTTPLAVGVNEAGAVISKCGTQLGGGAGGGAARHNAMSTSGQTIFFTAVCGERTASELYARVDNGEPGARTVDLSEPSKADCTACDTEAGVLAEAHFLGASEDGSKVFFSTTQPLLPGATGLNIYEYDFDAPAGERIARVTGGAPVPGIFEASNALVSEDGSHVYFIASGVLTTTANGQGEVAEAGAYNLYVFEREAGDPAGRTEFVARLSEQDITGLWEESNTAGAVTPDGRFLVFESERDLTPDTTSKGIWQLYEYDAQTGKVVRVSIGEDGFNNNGNVPAIPLFANDVSRVFDNANNPLIVTPSYNGAYSATRYWSHLSVSADGSYVFFQDPAGLTPQAVNDKLVGSFVVNKNTIPIYANNIYEYHAGQVSLISDGQDFSYHQYYGPGEASEVRLLSTDESGADVLFKTSDRLVGQDTDTSTDIYDARIDGGYPPPTVPPSCSGESCQGQLSGAPTLLSPGSEFQAGGNPPLAVPVVSKPAVKPKAKAKCKRGTTPKRGKCVKAKGKKAKQAANERRAK